MNDPSFNPRASPPRVLVIDDSEIALDVVMELLERHGIDAMGLAGPIGATNVVAKNQIRVVITDVNMPELAGTSLVGLFRDNTRTKHVKVILLSDLPESDLDKLVLSCKADGAVQKGKIEEQLIPMVRRLLHTKPSPGPMRAV